jgi:hypothetical protein
MNMNLECWQLRMGCEVTTLLVTDADVYVLLVGCGCVMFTCSSQPPPGALYCCCKGGGRARRVAAGEVRLNPQGQHIWASGIPHPVLCRAR